MRSVQRPVMLFDFLMYMPYAYVCYAPHDLATFHYQ